MAPMYKLRHILKAKTYCIRGKTRYLAHVHIEVPAKKKS